jgi:hypothetical protein
MLFDAAGFPDAFGRKGMVRAGAFVVNAFNLRLQMYRFFSKSKCSKRFFWASVFSLRVCAEFLYLFSKPKTVHMNDIIRKNGVTYGLILGILSIVITALFYAVNVKFFVNWWIGILLLVVNIVLYVLAISNSRKKLGGYITFKEAFTVFFIAAVIAMTLATVFNLVLFNFIDPGAKDTLKELTIKTSVEMMQKFNAPAQAINEAVAKMQDQDNYSPASLAKGWAIGLVVNCVLGLILAAIMKKKLAYQE